MTPADGPLVHGTTRRGIAVLTLDSPRNRNALSARMRSELAAGLERAVADDAVRAVLLTAEGPAFCAGVDLKEVEARRQGREPDPPDAPGIARLLQDIMAAPKPVVAKVAAPARAGGIGLVAAADIAVAADGVSFAFTEVRLGLVPAVISVPVTRRMAPRALSRYFLTGETFDAAEAAATGLLTRAVPAHELDAATEQILDGLRAAAPAALADTKRRALADPAADLDAQFARMNELSQAYFDSEDAAEGRASFRERRPPRWAVSAS